MNRNLRIIIIIAALMLFLVFCCACVIFGVGVFTFLNQFEDNQFSYSLDGFSTPTSTPVVIRPTITAEIPTPSAIPGTSGQRVESELPGNDDLFTMAETIIPPIDPLDLAYRFEGKTGLSRTSDAPEKYFEVGDQQSFWVLNADNNQNYEVQTTLQYVTDHLYFWIEDGVSFDEKQLSELADTFEREIYPTNRAFFGSEWSPGVDGDPHLYIVLAQDLGGTVAGYFSPGDEYLPDVKKFSNGHEMFLLSADRIDLGDEFTYGVLAHEFQHMIHWYRDLNEESWVNEGFSELAAFLQGYSTGRVEYAYTDDPDLQLTRWSSDPTTNRAHYGASFLFFTYFLDRFGEFATQSLVAHTANGMKSINLVLEELGITDPLTGDPIGADDVFADWVIANYLQDASAGDGRFTYHNFPSAPSTDETELIDDCPTETITRDVNQYGADYIKIDCQGEYIINFEGSLQVNILPTEPHSGSYTFFSNRADESNTTLTQSFDFSSRSGPLTLTYWTWYDIEEDYDYVYLSASTDGKNWDILSTPSGTGEDPSGNSYGWGYNGKSGGGPGWIQETVDISKFAGRNVQLRFEYVTDAAVNAEGFLLDDISIPEIEYFTDFEEDDGGWYGDGFVRIQNKLPQFFRLSLITAGDSNQVEYIQLSEDNSAAVPISIGHGVDEVILVVSGTTPFTRQKAAYQFSVQP